MVLSSFLSIQISCRCFHSVFCRACLDTGQVTKDTILCRPPGTCRNVHSGDLTPEPRNLPSAESGCRLDCHGMLFVVSYLALNRDDFIDLLICLFIIFISGPVVPVGYLKAAHNVSNTNKIILQSI